MYFRTKCSDRIDLHSKWLLGLVVGADIQSSHCHGVALPLARLQEAGKAVPILLGDCHQPQ